VQELRVDRPAVTSGTVFTVAFVISCAVAASVIGSFPLEMSIATIFLFAGVHNVMEFRYFIARMPVRWGKSRTYYSVGIGGVIALAASYLTLYFGTGNWLWSDETGPIFAAFWNTGLIVWVGTLIYLRGQQTKSRDWSWAIPAALFLAALAWLMPQYWSLALVYLHPFVAMWFLERQIRRTKREWLTAYRFCLACVPAFVAILWLLLANRPDLPESTPLFWRISQHAGGDILRGLSSHFLVATHVFLESIHYFVWILLIPMVDRRAIPWRLSEVPMFANGAVTRPFLAGAFVFAIGVVVALWSGFAVDYTATRDIYFAFAIGHVLAEFPFLIKML
jgi:hypothetical protein